MAIILQQCTHHGSSLRMIWDAKPSNDDVCTVFNQILKHLERSPEVAHIVVDVSARPDFPLATTLSGALRVQRHRRMGTWLVFGHSRTAELIANCLTVAGKKNIVWFESEQEALQELQNLTEKALLR